MIYLGAVGSTDITSWRYAARADLSYNATPTWGHASLFAKHWGVDDINATSGTPRRAYREIVYDSKTAVLNDMNYLVNNLEEGDVIQLYTTADSIYHSMIITSIDETNNDINYAQHTSNGPIISLKFKLNGNDFNGRKIIFYDMK